MTPINRPRKIRIPKRKIVSFDASIALLVSATRGMLFPAHQLTRILF
jgi:hypothetical protein